MSQCIRLPESPEIRYRALVSIERRTRWESATTIPLLILGATFIVSFSLLVLWYPMPEWLQTVLRVELAVVWVAFIVDLVVRIVLTPRGERWQFILQNPVDVLSTLLPVFRAFRVINLLRRAPIFARRTGNEVRVEVLAYAVSYAVLFVYFTALATLDVERTAPGATITSFGDAVWWACVTIATVGYGDTYPVTVLGRFYAVTLMLGGIAIVGTASALVFSYISEQIAKTPKRRP